MLFRTGEGSSYMLGTKIVGGGWRYKFSDSSAIVAGGITRVTVENRSQLVAGWHKFKIVARTGDFLVDPHDAPVRFVVIFGPSDGQCAAQAFNAYGGPVPSCRFTGSGNTLRCR